jgi:hypothetical protein
MDWFEQTKVRHPDGLPVTWKRWKASTIRSRILKVSVGGARPGPTHEDVRDALGLPGPSFEIDGPSG